MVFTVAICTDKVYSLERGADRCTSFYDVIFMTCKRRAAQHLIHLRSVKERDDLLFLVFDWRVR